MPRRAEDHLFFWKPTQENGWASQWFNSPFTESSDPAIGGIHFPTAEHYMMYHKAILFNDLDIANQILAADHPATAKELGRQVDRFDGAKWEAHRLDIVRRGNLLKFTQNPELKALLLATGDKILVEASPFDKIWGIGKTEDKAMPKDSWGLNLLGLALTDVRDQLRAADEGQESNVAE